MIVKVQRPLVGSPTSRTMPDILVYDRAHEHEVMVYRQVLPDWLAEAMADCPKVFAEAEWSQRWERWRFNGLAEWQPW